MTNLDRKFVELAQKSPVELDHGDHTARFEATDATAGQDAATTRADLAVVVDGILVGYITPFAEDELGVISVSDFGEVEPTTFHTIEGALEQLIPGAADGFATPALQQ